MVFEHPDFDGHEEIVAAYDEASGLRAIIAVHDTTLGPACGGTRMRAYRGSAEALTDALRLSRAMTMKSAVADLPLGGGKAVIIGDPRVKSPALLAAYARAIDRLGGRYVTAMDVGMTPGDMEAIARGTVHVSGFDQPGKTGGNSGPLTALGVFEGLRAAVRHRLHTDDLRGLRIAVQGLGAVGFDLCERLHAAGATLFVADLDRARVARAVAQLGAHETSPEDILLSDVDVIAPCALGGVIACAMLDRLKARVIAGGANNQLASGEVAAALTAKGVLYAPDYVINGGGIIRVAGQLNGWSDQAIEARVRAIGATLGAIFTDAAATGETTAAIAERRALGRIQAAREARETGTLARTA